MYKTLEQHGEAAITAYERLIYLLHNQESKLLETPQFIQQTLNEFYAELNKEHELISWKR